MGAESPENTLREATAQVQEEDGRTGVDFTYDQSASRLTYRDLVSNEITINGADIIGTAVAAGAVQDAVRQHECAQRILAIRRGRKEA